MNVAAPIGNLHIMGSYMHGKHEIHNLALKTKNVSIKVHN